MAVGNDWGTTLEGEVEDQIFHKVDDPSLGYVTFIPFVGYDQIEEITASEIDLTKADIYTLTGQRVNYSESLKPGVYIVITEQNANKIVIQ